MALPNFDSLDILPMAGLWRHTSLSAYSPYELSLDHVQLLSCLSRPSVTKLHWREHSKIWTIDMTHSFKQIVSSTYKIPNPHRSSISCSKITITSQCSCNISSQCTKIKGHSLLVLPMILTQSSYSLKLKCLQLHHLITYEEAKCPICFICYPAVHFFWFCYFT